MCFHYFKSLLRDVGLNPLSSWLGSRRIIVESSFELVESLFFVARVEGVSLGS